MLRKYLNMPAVSTNFPKLEMEALLSAGVSARMTAHCVFCCQRMLRMLRMNILFVPTVRCRADTKYQLPFQLDYSLSLMIERLFGRPNPKV
jgi:hypothetical protein